MNLKLSLGCRLLVSAFLLWGCQGTLQAKDLFRKQIAPLLQSNCLSCHNPQDRKGGLSLHTRQALLKGGESGQIVYPGDPASSYLLDLVTPAEGKAAMPQGTAPLAASEIAALRSWIEKGAPWPKEVVLTPTRWWSLRPLTQPEVPEISSTSKAWVRNPVDAFVAARHAALGLQPADEVDRRTLIRRLYFDLIGLPPEPEAVDRFVADRSADAYEKLVDRLLASPHYGERWARHWLDVVHYGETHGYDKDKPRPHAWPYRDYVIRSLNEDKPYRRFVQEQVAGDALFPGTAEGIEALGFLAAGPWDFIGHVEVPASKTDGKIARHLDRDDMVRNTIMTFCSLTVGCAQCHDHKFDPIPQADYYSLQAVFSALDRADRKYFSEPAAAKKYDEWKATERTLEKSLAKIQQEIGKQAGAELAAVDRKIASAAKGASGRPPQYGYHSRIEPAAECAKWVQVDLGQPQAISQVELVAAYDDFNNIGAGFGFPVRFKVELAQDADCTQGRQVIVDRTKTNVANPGVVPQQFAAQEKVGRYVRVTATRLAPRKNDYIFALAELRVLDADGRNLAAGKPVTALDSIEAPVRWAKKNLVDGIDPGTSGSNDPVEDLQRQREQLLREKVSAELLSEAKRLRVARGEVRKQLKKLPSPQTVYAAVVHHGSGNFRGTGPAGGNPRTIHILRRGNVNDLGQEVSPGTLSCLEELPSRFPKDASDQERRAALARWLTAEENPLVWRSIVNRVWLYHFGRGLVDTPNDFGRMGKLPSHPKLLDWLAADFRRHQSLKQLHRLIVSSSTYRQNSTGNPKFAQVDGSNAYYWRMNRKRLEAEAVRDAMLSVAGKLNLKMGGPSFQDFVIEKPQHSPHYQYHLHDPADPQSHRRSIYRMVVRSQTQPFLTVMDCADPSMMVAKRTETTSPLQALALLNNKFSLVMARYFAQRLRKDGAVEEQLETAFQLALGRSPLPAELTRLKAYTQEHGLENTCRVLLNLNEFLYVD